MGERAARRYFVTAERFTAARAAELGLISEVVAEDALDSAISTVIESILANGPEAVMAAKDLVQNIAGQPIDSELIEDTCARIAHIRVSREGQEGLSAFLNKRKPNWQDE
jgi:methylglutaconyl-CoA hydratase